METASAHKSPPKRRYDSSRRAEQAAETRRRVVAAAADCFMDQGYGPTTMAQIAKRAGVSTETVNGNGPKRSLLIAAFSQTFVGVETEEDVAQSPPWSDVLALDDPDAFLEATADLIVAGQQAGIRIWRVVSAAATEEPDVAQLYHELAVRRRASAVSVTRALDAKGWLRPGRSVDEHADTLALLAGFDPYQLFVADFGRTTTELRTWFIDAVRTLVLAPDAGRVPAR